VFRNAAHEQCGMKDVVQNKQAPNIRVFAMQHIGSAKQKWQFTTSAKYKRSFAMQLIGSAESKTKFNTSAKYNRFSICSTSAVENERQS